MKKLLSIIAILGFVQFSGLMAQDGTYDNRGGLGLKGGLTFSTIGFNNEDAETHKNRFRVGGTAGLGYEFGTEGVFAFELGLMYDLRGTKEEVRLSGGNEIVQKNYLHYISMPANFKFYIGDNFNVHFGPYVAVLAGGKSRFELVNTNGEVIETRDFKITGDDAQDLAGNDYLRKFDAGLQAGIEFISDGGIGIGTNFSKGIVDITRDEHFLGRGYASTTEISVYMIFRL